MCPPGQPKRSLNICACTTFQHPVLLQRPSKCRLNLPRLELNPTYKWPPQTAAAPRVGDGARPSCWEVFMDTVMHVKVQNSRHLCWGALCLASRLSRADTSRTGFADPNFQLQRGRFTWKAGVSSARTRLHSHRLSCVGRCWHLSISAVPTDRRPAPWPPLIRSLTHPPSPRPLRAGGGWGVGLADPPTLPKNSEQGPSL